MSWSHWVFSGGRGGDGGNAIVSNNGMKLHWSVNGPRDTGSWPAP